LATLIPVPKKIFLKKKTHGKADARALTGAEIAEREYQARDAALAASYCPQRW